MKINCNFCNKVFNKKPYAIKDKNYCNKQCRHLDKYSICSCTTCGKKFEKINTQIFPNNFYSRFCRSLFTSARMTAMNIKLNPTRMILSTRLKLRAYRLKNSKGCKSYKKFLGRHVHRIVAEKAIGRKLIKGEVVHHKDENIHNNTSENLAVLSSQSEHAKIHMLKRWRNN